MIITIALYVATVTLTWFGIISYPIYLIAKILTFIIPRKPTSFITSLMVGSMMVWFVIDIIWKELEGGHIPLLGLVICLGIKGYHAFSQKNSFLHYHRISDEIDLYKFGKKIEIAFEAVGMIVIGLVLSFLTSAIRWF